MTGIFCLLTLSSASLRLWVGIDVDEVVLIPIAVLLMGKILSQRDSLIKMGAYFVVFLQVIVLTFDGSDENEWNLILAPTYFLVAGLLISQLSYYYDDTKVPKDIRSANNDIVQVLNIAGIFFLGVTLFLLCEVLNGSTKYQEPAIAISSMSLIVISIAQVQGVGQWALEIMLSLETSNNANRL